MLYIGSFRIDPHFKYSSYIIVNSQGYIMELSAACINMFGITI